MKVYTKTGDEGTTGLVGGTRVPKYHYRLEAYGTVDELNSWIGLIRGGVISREDKDILVGIQHRLFNIGSILATDTGKIDISGKQPCSEHDITVLENEIDRINEALPPLTSFILPGGNDIVSHCHLARTVCRRAERRAYEMAKKAEVPKIILKYLNRLSDYLFVLSRKMAADCGTEELEWKR